MNNDELLLAHTPEGKAYRENGVRNLQTLLEAQTDWESAAQRESDFADFREIAKNLRAADASIPDLPVRSYRGVGSVTFQAEYAWMLEKIYASLESAGIAFWTHSGEQSKIVVSLHQDTEEKQTLVHTLAALYKGEDTWGDVLETAAKWDRFTVRFPGFWILIADSELRGVLQQFDDTPEGYSQARRFCVKMSELDVLEDTKTVEQLEEEWEKILDADEEEDS